MKASPSMAAALLGISCALGCGLFGPPAPRAEIRIATTWPGASPEEVEQGLLIPLEESVAGVSGVASIASSAGPGAGEVWVELESGVDADEALAEVASFVQLDSLPQDAEPPTIHQIFPSRVVSVAVARGQAVQAKENAERTPGVLSVAMVGHPRDRWVVELDPARLAAYGLTVEEVVASRPIPVTPRIRPQVDLEGWRVPIDGGAAGKTDLLVSDLATIRNHTAPDKPVSVDGRPGTILTIRLSDDADEAKVLSVLVDAAPDLVPLEGLTRLELSGPRAKAVAYEVAEAHSPRVVVYARDAELWFDPAPTRLRSELAGEPEVDARWPTPHVHSVVIAGPHDADAQTVVDAVADAIEAQDEVSGVRRPIRAEPEIEVRIDRERAARLGVSTFLASRAARAAVGLEIESGLEVRLAGSPGEIQLRAADGGLVPLSAVSTQVLLAPQLPIHRLDGRRVHRLTVWTAREGARPDLSSVPLPEGWTVEIR